MPHSTTSLKCITSLFEWWHTQVVSLVSLAIHPDDKKDAKDDKKDTVSVKDMTVVQPHMKNIPNNIDWFKVAEELEATQDWKDGPTVLEGTELKWLISATIIYRIVEQIQKDFEDSTLFSLMWRHLIDVLKEHVATKLVSDKKQQHMVAALTVRIRHDFENFNKGLTNDQGSPYMAWMSSVLQVSRFPTTAPVYEPNNKPQGKEHFSENPLSTKETADSGWDEIIHYSDEAGERAGTMTEVDLFKTRKFSYCEGALDRMTEFVRLDSKQETMHFLLQWGNSMKERFNLDFFPLSWTDKEKAKSQPPHGIKDTPLATMKYRLTVSNFIDATKEANLPQELLNDDYYAIILSLLSDSKSVWCDKSDSTIMIKPQKLLWDRLKSKWPAFFDSWTTLKAEQTKAKKILEKNQEQERDSSKKKKSKKRKSKNDTSDDDDGDDEDGGDGDSDDDGETGKGKKSKKNKKQKTELEVTIPGMFEKEGALSNLKMSFITDTTLEDCGISAVQAKGVTARNTSNKKTSKGKRAPPKPKKGKRKLQEEKKDESDDSDNGSDDDGDGSSDDDDSNSARGPTDFDTVAKLAEFVGNVEFSTMSTKVQQILADDKKTCVIPILSSFLIDKDGTGTDSNKNSLFWVAGPFNWMSKSDRRKCIAQVMYPLIMKKYHLPYNPVDHFLTDPSHPDKVYAVFNHVGRKPPKTREAMHEALNADKLSIDKKTKFVKINTGELGIASVSDMLTDCSVKKMASFQSWVVVSSLMTLLIQATRDAKDLSGGDPSLERLYAVKSPKDDGLILLSNIHEKRTLFPDWRKFIEGISDMDTGHDVTDFSKFKRKPISLWLYVQFICKRIIKSRADPVLVENLKQCMDPVWKAIFVQKLPLKSLLTKLLARLGHKEVATLMLGKINAVLDELNKDEKKAESDKKSGLGDKSNKSDNKSDKSDNKSDNKSNSKSDNKSDDKSDHKTNDTKSTKKAKKDDDDKDDSKSSKKPKKDDTDKKDTKKESKKESKKDSKTKSSKNSSDADDDDSTSTKSSKTSKKKDKSDKKSSKRKHKNKSNSDDDDDDE